jgi:hypothetical protein
MSEESVASYDEFSWYKTGTWPTLEQGDLLSDCLVPVPPPDLTAGLIGVQKDQAFESEFDLKPSDLIILTQSCDLAKEDVTQVLLCGHFPAENYSKEVRKTIRREHRPALHMIEACELSDSQFGQRVIDFRTAVVLPKDYLLAFVNEQKSRVRLLPPYREHLAQAFARFFMRVGLPRNLREL